MLNSLRMALVITYREVRDQFSDWRIIFPVIVLTLFFPGLMNFTADQAVNFVQRYNAPVVGERLIPFLLMVVGFFPISVSLVIALESFVGEKERRSIEPLLSSPLTDGQLYLGKLLAAMVPPLLGSYLGITVYLAGVFRNINWQPDTTLIIQILILTTVQAVVMVSGAVVVSSQTTSVRAANLLASFIIVPMAMLIQGESIVMFWAIYDVLWWAIVGQLVIAGLLIRTGLAYFNREEMLGRELDVLNLSWGWKVFKRAITGQAHSLGAWLRHEIPAVLLELRLPTLVMLATLTIGILAGVHTARILPLPANLLNLDNLGQGFIQGLDEIRFLSPAGVGLIWWHNLRAVLIATLLGIFSFGVIGVLVLALPLMLISYLATNVAAAGYSVFTFLTALVLPHGVVEIPAIILAGAAVLKLGATLAAPARGKTIGEAWLGALAQWVKTMLIIVLPLFLLAAIAEVFITPQVAVWLLGR
ncbi:MAG: stage II sporulation protein M [Anaerolineales bacterium]|nr:stage II sporulation protein M [Anaerolineales bacterium]